MPEYIKRETLIEIAAEQGHVTIDDIINEPAADVAPVRPELRKAVKLLHDEYANTKRLSFVRNPLAYALYQVWKAADGGARMDLTEGDAHDT